MYSSHSSSTSPALRTIGQLASWRLRQSSLVSASTTPLRSPRTPSLVSVSSVSSLHAFGSQLITPACRIHSSASQAQLGQAGLRRRRVQQGLRIQGLGRQDRLREVTSQSGCMQRRKCLLQPRRLAAFAKGENVALRFLFPTIQRRSKQCLRSSHGTQAKPVWPLTPCAAAWRHFVPADGEPARPWPLRCRALPLLSACLYGYCSPSEPL